MATIQQKMAKKSPKNLIFGNFDETIQMKPF